MEELVAELTHLARRSPDISQRSGVSVRVSVANMEVLEAAALKRAVRLGEPVGCPRVSDLGAVLASTTGKVEVESVGDETPEERIVERLVTKAVFAVFNRHASLDRLETVIEAFEEGAVVRTGDRVPSQDYVRAMGEIPGLREAVVRTGVLDTADGGEEPALVAAGVELVLEGLHLHRRLNKDRAGGAGVAYRR
jgi:magnesium chelatase subunit I